MQIINTIKEIRETVERLRGRGRKIALVPTMGALHEGHLSLISLAKKKADVCIVTIFVNPTQFGPNEDFDKYPRNLEQDAALCESKGADYIFAPSRDEIYPADYSTFVTEERYSKGMCGVSRPGHFRGVCTVVLKLFNICTPDVAVFGQKDAQQCAVIRKMVRDLCLSVNIVTAPTLRDPDGLAMSSRNAYLSKSQRVEALRIHAALQAGLKLVEQGVTQVDRIQAEVTNKLIVGRRLRVIYVEICDAETMEPVRLVNPGKCLIAVAAWVDEVRLIDNILI